jgi:hypothetical protein
MSFQRNHIVSAGHLKRFAKGKLVVVHNALTGATREVGPRAAGFQNDFWGPESLARAVEEAFNKCETPALQILQNISEQWPLNTPDRALLAEFLAIHVIRTLSFGAIARRSGLRAVRDVARRHDLSSDQVSVATRRVMGPHMHIEALLGQVGRIGSVFGSMHWSLVQFDQDLLITSDQPVIMLPLTPTAITPASVIPPNGTVATVEVCFTLDPRQALLLTWADLPDTAQPLAGTYRQACSINCALRAQAWNEWVSRPQTSPPFLSPPLLQPQIYPISTELILGYTVEIAGQSRRRAETERLARGVAESDAPRDRMRWVRIEHRDAA